MKDYKVYGLNACSEYEQRKFGEIVRHNCGFVSVFSEDIAVIRCYEETTKTLEFLFDISCVAL